MHTINERARSYLSRYQAVSGQGGHQATFQAALALVKGFGLSEAQALPLLQEWNATHARPRWTDAELRHKLHDAMRADRPFGYLLQTQESDPLGDWKRRPVLPLGYAGAEAEAAAKRARWPSFRALREEERRTIARLRGVPMEAVAMLHEAGLLKGASVEGAACFVLHQGGFAQARRLDGQHLTLRDGRQVKAKNLPGSRGAFVGQGWLGRAGATGGAPPVLLVEGAIGLLEGLAAAWLVGADAGGWTVLAATSAQSRFDEQLLNTLADRRVRLVPDADAAGCEAVGFWTADLRRVGCTVDAYRLPPGFKDLGEVVRDDVRDGSTLTQIFTQ